MPAGNRNLSCAFTIVHLLVVIGILILLFAALLPTLDRMRETSSHVRCSSNLRQIGQAMQMYSNTERDGAFPRTWFDHPDTGATSVDLSNAGFVDSGTSPVNSFSASNTPASANLPANSVGGSFFLLLKTQDLTPDVFVCPSSNGTRGFQTFSVQNSNNFGGWKGAMDAMGTRAGSEWLPDVTYSYQNPFPSKAYGSWFSKFRSGWISSDFVLAADVNPGTQTIDGVSGSPATVNPTDPAGSRPDGTGQAFGNSINHNRMGQNVLYGDGHVEFQTTCWCGSYRTTQTTEVRDNIYTNGTQTSAGGSFGTDAMPQDYFDSVCLPTSN